MIDIADLKTVGGRVGDSYGEFSFVTPLSEEQMESRQEVDGGWW